MGCSSCGSHAPIKVNKPAIVKTTPARTQSRVVARSQAVGVVVPASKDKSVKVKLRYFGGESKKTTGGCSTCGGSKGGYAKTTVETIMFVSEDEPSKLFKLQVSIGRDYYVTEEQAKYLLTLTYQNRGGETVHKFQKVG